ncbi:MAG TPA: CDP-alcohol phosphatidyltransferase family protein [Acidobacteriota bacterium]|nr:CDP-alcohol phosphatidyltransferase family protein [Acidobacteriota bacterium]
MNDTSSVRKHGGLLEVPERKALLWLARRMPSRVNSDHLSILGLAAMFLAGFSFWAAQWNKYALLMAVVALVLNWFGDSLDGTLARVRQRQRPRYGYYVDHVIDLIGTTALMCGIALSGYMSELIALALLAAFLLVEAEVFLSAHVQSVFKLSCFRIGPTELRIVLAIGTVSLLHSPSVDLPVLGSFLLFDLGGIVAIAGMLVAFFYSAAKNWAALYRAEPLEKEVKK